MANERAQFRIELVIRDEPQIIEKMETKFINLSLKENVVSFHITKDYL